MVVMFHGTIEAQAASPGAGPAHRALLDVLSRLWLGVPFFFVISGYCIAASIENHRLHDRGWGEFFRRRFRRIYPTYWAAMLLTAALLTVLSAAGLGALALDGSHRFPTPGSLNLSQWFGNVTLTERWRYHFWGTQSLLLGTAWSLCYEEQFYAASGILFAWTRRHFYRACTVVTLLVVALLPWTLTRPDHFEGFFFDGRWLLFAMGMLVFWKVRFAPPGIQLRCDLLLGTVLIAALGLRFYGLQFLSAAPAARTIGTELVFGAGFALLISRLHRLDTALAGNAVVGRLCRMGPLTYSIYLVHWPLVKPLGSAVHLWLGEYPAAELAVSLVTALVVSVVGGWALHRLVERHFLNPPASVVDPITREAARRGRAASALSATS